MFADSDIAQDSKAAGDDGLDLDTPKRQMLVAPPLVPALPADNREGLPFLMIVAIAVLAGLAHLTGAPAFITIGLLATGLGGLAMHLSNRRTERRGIRVGVHIHDGLTGQQLLDQRPHLAALEQFGILAALVLCARHDAYLTHSSKG